MGDPSDERVVENLLNVKHSGVGDVGGATSQLHHAISADPARFVECFFRVWEQESLEHGNMMVTDFAELLMLAGSATLESCIIAVFRLLSMRAQHILSSNATNKTRLLEQLCCFLRISIMNQHVGQAVFESSADEYGQPIRHQLMYLLLQV